LTRSKIYDIAIIGGGIVGMATAMTLLTKYNLSLVVVEAEQKLASHQTGNNSGVIHSGLYYKPGSLKAKNCVAGRNKLYQFCREQGILYDQCGKVVVATNPNETLALDELEKRGKTNGLIGIKRLNANEIKEHEPYCSGLEGLFIPETGIVDFIQVTQTYAKIVKNKNGEIKTDTKFLNLQHEPTHLVLETTKEKIGCKYLINCAGLQSDRIAKKCGANPDIQIVPFRGEYYEIKPEKRYLVKNLIYPVPDPRFPFLGVHFTRMIHGGVEAGPNAVLAFKREGYQKLSFSFPDTFATIGYRGFWSMASKYWKMGMGEYYRSFYKKAFVRALQRLIPDIQAEDVYPAGAGVRAQALERKGGLIDDFCILEQKNMIHILNAPSPAATASLSIANTIASMAEKNFNLKKSL
jgi:L-2-hydroxyglutarate oxidase